MMSMLERFDKLVAKHAIAMPNDLFNLGRVLVRVIEDDRLDRERERQAEIEARIASLKQMPGKL
jgi:ABC-type metal ion transport system substrate-binding protein